MTLVFNASSAALVACDHNNGADVQKNFDEWGTRTELTGSDCV